MGVSFFVDPSILEDRNLDEVTTITLSYTFFRNDGGEETDEDETAALSDGRPVGTDVN